MITFKELYIEGFASLIKPLTFNLDNPGLNIIQAPNGFGKTSIISALCWVVYGKPIKERASIETWEKFRTKDYRGVYGYVDFTISNIKYRILRCKDFKGQVLGAKGANRIILLINGQDYSKLQTENRDKKDIQSKINEILGMSYNLFKSSVVFGQKVKRIIDESNPNKKEVFEEAFEASFLNKALDLAKKELVEKQVSQRTLSTDLDLLETKLEHSKELLHKSQEFNKLLEKDLIALEEKYIAYLEQLKQEEIKVNNLPKGNISKVTKELKGLEEKEKEKFITEKKLYGLQADIKVQSNICNSLNNELIQVRGKLGALKTKCSSCGQSIPKETINAQKQTLTSNIKVLSKKQQLEDKLLKEKQSELKAIQDKLSSFKSLNGDITILKSKLKKLENGANEAKICQNNLLNIKSKLEDLEKQKIAISDKSKAQANPKTEKKLKIEIKALKLKIKPLKKAYKRLKSDIELLNWVISSPLSNKGLKAYIFNTMLGRVNERLIYYAKYLGFQIEFGIDLNSTRKDFYTVIYRKDQVCSYDDLSGGQQQLVNVALALSIHDTLNENPEKNTNLLIFDEVFENLDEINTDLVAELISTKAKDKAIYLITHNKEFNASNSNIISLVYRDGNTMLG